MRSAMSWVGPTIPDSVCEEALLESSYRGTVEGCRVLGLLLRRKHGERTSGDDGRLFQQGSRSYRIFFHVGMKELS